MRKHNRIVFFMLILAFIFVTTACGNGKTGTSAADDVVTEFLTHFYTTDDNDRYTDLQTADITEQEMLEKAMETYYSELAPFVTEELLEKLQSNRLPYLQDELDKEKGIICDAPEVDLNTIDGKENSYEFTVIRTAEDIRTGEITYTETEKGYLVNYFYEER